jgi:hypothetical protein
MRTLQRYLCHLQILWARVWCWPIRKNVKEEVCNGCTCGQGSCQSICHVYICKIAWHIHVHMMVYCVYIICTYVIYLIFMHGI